ncbi:MVP [Symbiodinium natans]|uniref:MVP protein n=1 Tax=Symbiodinium natans TaxID=878477 RepID=A0A812RR99_9DINO|nr:MVP [Symbiodinium natans]
MAVPILPSLVVLGVAGLASFGFQLITLPTLVLVLGLVSVIGVCIAVGQRAIHCLGQDEQVWVEGFTGAYVQNGPGVAILNPLTYRLATRRKAETLGNMDYVKVRDSLEGKERVEKGPKLFFLSAYEQVVERKQGLSLGSTEFAIVEDRLTGERRIVKGPCMFFPGPHEDANRGAAVSLSRIEYLIVEDQLTGDKKVVKGPAVWFPGPYERSSAKTTAIALQEDEYIKVKDTSSGKRWIEKGKALVFPEPTWHVEGATAKCSGICKAWALKSYEFVRLMDTVTGKVASYRGEQTVFPSPDDELLDGGVMEAMDLKVHEYVKLLDQSTGVIRVESGSNGSSKQVFLGPHDKVLDNGKKKAVEVDDEHAVLVRDKSTGQVRLVTEKQLFVPGPNETIEKVQELIRLADHEALIVKNREGEFQYFYGSEEKRSPGQPRAFFLEPYAETVKLCWSKGRRRETRNLFIERFDCRAQFMSFEFNCRTSDNVELILEGTFFWEVVDLPAMVKSTGDTSGDLCNHARSQFIRHVAKVTLKEFMDSSHAIAKRVWEEDTEFYASRGVKIHSLEVTRYQCADSRTSEILEQIIQETTNRMNRLSQAESENEVSLFRTHGQIEQERLNGELLAIKHQHSEAEAEVVGRAEANRVSAFIAGLEPKVEKLEDRIALWQVLRKNEALSCISEGNASLYYTPSDVDLSIESKKM